MRYNYIIDSDSGTILNEATCYVVDAEHLKDDIFISDSDAAELCTSVGVKVSKYVHAETVSEDEAYQLFLSFKKRFGWSGSVFTVDDIVDELECRLVEPTDGIIDAVVNSYEWRKSLPNLTASWGFDCLTAAVDGVLGVADVYRLED